MAACAGAARHWYTIWGAVGLRSPVCVRCGEPNPRPLSDEQWRELTGFRETRGVPFPGRIEAAIEERKAAHLSSEFMGRDAEGYLVVFNRDGQDVRVTECCYAGAKGLDDCIGCRRCFREVDPAIGGQPVPPYTLDGQVTFAGPKARGWGDAPAGWPYYYTVSVDAPDVAVPVEPLTVKDVLDAGRPPGWWWWFRKEEH